MNKEPRFFPIGGLFSYSSVITLQSVRGLVAVMKISHTRISRCLAYLSATERASALQLIPKHSTVLGIGVSSMYLLDGRMRP